MPQQAHLLVAILLFTLGHIVVGANSRAVSSHVEDYLRDSRGDVSFDKLHRATILDFDEQYIEPIKSLDTRQVSSLDGLWDFCFDRRSEGFKAAWFERPLVESCPPHDLHLMPVPSAFNEILSDETAKNYMGWTWYQTRYSWPATELANVTHSQWLIQFESINYLSLIWAEMTDRNAGRDRVSANLLAGTHAGGHLPIVINITELIHGQDAYKSVRGLNLRLTVAVSNMLTSDTIPSGQLINRTDLVGKPSFRFQPDFDFFHFAGLMGSVRLVKLPLQYIKRVYFRSHPSQLNVTVCFQGGGEVARVLDGKHEVVFFGPSGYNVIPKSQSSAGRRLGGECVSFVLPLGLENRLTSENIRSHSSVTTRNQARANEFRITLEEDMKPLDEFELPLIEQSGLEQFAAERTTANNQQLQGFGMHHEQLFSGRAMSLPAIMKDLQLVKQMGANLIRTSHYPYSSAYLDACDQLGIMVIAECPAVGLNTFSELKLKLHKQMLREMILRDQDHPSIVMWSVANEPASQHPEARAYFDSLLKYVRDELLPPTPDDPQPRRPLTAAIAQSHEADQVADLLDVLMVNRYYGWYEFTGELDTIRPALRASLVGWAQKHPGKPLLVSEFGADTLAGLHSGEIFSEEYQRALIEEHEGLFDELVSVANKSEMNFLGAMIWNFADFSTHETLLRVGGNKKGLFTSDRRPKMAAEAVRRIFTSRQGEY